MTDDRDDAPTELPARVAALRLILFGLAIVGLAALAAGVGPDVEAIRGWATATGWVAPLAFVLLYAGLTVALVPGSVLTLAAGLLFGVGLGSVVAIIGATAGATVAFSIARSTGRAAAERLLSGRAARVDRWLEGRGLLAVVTLRLVPLVPFAVSNYAAGVTAIRSRDFVAGTAIGIVPGAVAYTILGARVTDPTDPLFLAAIGALAILAVGGSFVLHRSTDPARSSPWSSVAPPQERA